MKKKLFSISVLLLTIYQASSQNYHIKSPDGNIEINIDNSVRITWSASLNGNVIIDRAEAHV